ncbi:MAG: SufE family protein [Pseudomonadota bacterium]
MNTRGIQEEIIEEFSFFDDWMDRYQYIIDLGRKLPAFPEADKTEANRLHGCQSQVWLTVSGGADEMTFAAVSDSAIVCGLIALVLRVYSGQPAQTILDTPPDFVEKIGLSSHLSPTRSNGLASMLETIKGHAARQVADAQTH